jgi:ligand-binding sensor domain-containing protein
VIKKIIPFFLIILAVVSCRDDEVNKTVVLPDLNGHQISSLVFDNEGILWVGTDTGLFKKVKDGFEMTGILNESGITALAFEKNADILWAGTAKGLARLSLSGSSPESDTIAAGNLSNPSVNCVYVDSVSDKWFGTEVGITRNSGDLWQKAKFKKNVSGTISSLIFENMQVNSIGSFEGDYYFATNGNSLHRTFNWNESVNAFSGATQWLNPYNGMALCDTMYVVFIDSRGRQWFGGQEGLQMHSGHDPKMENYPFYDELADPRVHCIAEAPDGKIWAGTENGISVYDNSAWLTKEVSLPDKFVTAIAIDKDGTAWIGTRKGLFSLK